MYRSKIFLFLTSVIFLFLFIGRYASASPIFEDVYFFTERVEWMPGADNWGYQFGGFVYDEDTEKTIISVTSQDVINGNTYSLLFDGCAEHVKTARECNRKRPPKTTENGHLVHSDRGHFSEFFAPAGRFRLFCS